MKIKLIFLAWCTYLWMGIQSGDPMQLFFAGFFLLLHLGTWSQRYELRAEEAKVAVEADKAKSSRK
jgi:hypothetical protein